MNHSPSLPHASEIPQASVSETKLIGSPPAVGADALEDDWPTLATLSRRYIGRALERTSGNKTQAAGLLGIDRRTLNRIMLRDRARKAAGLKTAPHPGAE